MKEIWMDNKNSVALVVYMHTFKMERGAICKDLAIG